MCLLEVRERLLCVNSVESIRSEQSSTFYCIAFSSYGFAELQDLNCPCVVLLVDPSVRVNDKMFTPALSSHNS